MMNQKAMMPTTIRLSLIAFFLLSSYGNAFVLQANEEIHLIKLHGQKAISKNQRTQFKIVESQEPLARMLTIDSANGQISRGSEGGALTFSAIFAQCAKQLGVFFERISAEMTKRSFLRLRR